jgi:hypothetical protein
MSPAWDSDPGRDPKPPSKFIHETTNSTAFSTSITSNFPCQNLNITISYTHQWHFIKLIKARLLKNCPSQQLFKVFIYIYLAATCFGPRWPSSGGINNYFPEVTSLQRSSETVHTAHTGTTPHYKTTQVNHLQNTKRLGEQDTRQQQDIIILTRKPGNYRRSSPLISTQNTWKSSLSIKHGIDQAIQDIPQPRARTIWNNLLWKTTFNTMHWYNVLCL